MLPLQVDSLPERICIVLYMTCMKSDFEILENGAIREWKVEWAEDKTSEKILLLWVLFLYEFQPSQ